VGGVSFLLASLIGTGPIVFVYAWAGAVSRQTGNALPAVIMLVAVAAFGWILYRARVANTTTSPRGHEDHEDARS